MSLIPLSQIEVMRERTPSVMKLRLMEQEVTGYWSVIFSPLGIKSLTKQDVTGFLRYEQNRRWRELSKEDVTRDMESLRLALACLVDESVSIVDRLNRLEPGRGELAIPFLGKAKLTAILLVTHPRQYGVWNDYSERALTELGLMPTFEAGIHLGDMYERFNQVLLGLAAEYKLTLWWLDTILEQLVRRVR
jgi:hypothetical protein